MKGVDTIDVWQHVLSDLRLTEVVSIAEFLREEVEVLPPRESGLLRSAIEDGRFGAIAKEALEREARAPSSPKAESVPPPSGVVTPEKEPGLESVLSDPTSGSVDQYQNLRTLQRTLPNRGSLVDAAASLTHAIAGVGASYWIDAQPSVAGLLERRLDLSKHRQAGYERAKIRAAWPTRQEEVEFTVHGYNSAVLNSRALAALVDDNPVEAATMALASIGASEAADTLPSELVVRILFAASTQVGRGHESHRQAAGYLQRFKRYGRPYTLLQAWLLLAAGSTADVERLLNTYASRMFETEAEYLSLRYVCSSGTLEDLRNLNSWAGCRTAGALLTAASSFHPPGLLRDRITSASNEIALRAGALANLWPQVALRSPGAQGRSPWQWKLSEIAAKLLRGGLHTAAAAVFEAALDEMPGNATFINNRAFCLMPTDPEVALAELDRAAAMYPRPFAVNVANRMLLSFGKGAHVEVLEIADRYRELGQSESSSGDWWLWDIDDRATLRDVTNIYKYIADIAIRSARALSRYVVSDKWHEWEQEMSGSSSENEMHEQ